MWWHVAMKTPLNASWSIYRGIVATNSLYFPLDDGLSWPVPPSLLWLPREMYVSGALEAIGYGQLNHLLNWRPIQKSISINSRERERVLNLSLFRLKPTKTLMKFNHFCCRNFSRIFNIFVKRSSCLKVFIFNI